MATNNKFYITTPIYYPSGQLQLGNTYTTVLADSLARFHRLKGEEVYFLTGSDEHGLKIELKAKENHQKPIEYLDEQIANFKKLWKLMDISYDQFIRTTNPDHEKLVQHIFSKLKEQGDIYKGIYQGWYSVSDEEYFTESQLAEVYRDESGQVIGGKAPSGHEVELVKEETYFFKMSKYADWLLNYYHEHPDFIQPTSRMNEMINNFIKPGLEDLAVTRTKVDWGVKVPDDPSHVIYVWIDALSNYITALGYDPNLTEQPELFSKFWPANLHLVGKEIVRFHTIYWPIMLHALNLPLPKEVFGHGWLIMKDGKMSKSKGNVIYPEPLIERYGLDAVRYYLLRMMPYGNDGVFTPEDFVTRINSDLANDLGNLLNRTVSMINLYNDGMIPAITDLNEEDCSLEDLAQTTIEEFDQAMQQTNLSDALEIVWRFIRRTNKYIDETSPWVLAKDPALKDKLNDVLAHLAAALRLIGLLLEPIMTQTPKKIFSELGIDHPGLLTEFSFKDLPNNAQVVQKPTPIFPRMKFDEEVEFVGKLVSKNMKVKGRAQMEEKKKAEQNIIDYDDFSKVKMIVAQVKSAEFLSGSKKLIKFIVDDGKNHERQILSGIRPWYPEPEVLVGKKLIIAANLAPRKMAGSISDGMILAGENSDGNVVVTTLPDILESGAEIS
ncbi:methionine--tRNA ligase [Xylocopilactobacillus apicola]|uniref:Methionine--tRNA ligase n=1 Tax=Xylocopilactobacillus apicola TaxID=2932184 RepID=A0AAU9DA94_9LACO|nr:methionine--tRNA ligase [Xylocopilactobacillus apicola]BDR58435.1 methionine--tRNA ligase [Xylocopilactobacillus apicola]